jgi:TrwC relaxase
VAVTVITKLVKGFDPDYPFRQQGRWAGDYFDAKGEPRGRWWGSGARELGLEPGSEIDRRAHRMVIAGHLDPRDGETRLGRAPGNAAARAEALYQEKLKAEPHATVKRQFELRREAAREARQGPVHLELDNSFSKTISVFYASLGENARSARLAGDEAGRAYWSGLLRELDEMIYEANQAGLDYFEREAGYTRSGYHGRRVDGRETGHLARSLAQSTWRCPDCADVPAEDFLLAMAKVAPLGLAAALRARAGVRPGSRLRRCLNRPRCRVTGRSGRTRTEPPFGAAERGVTASLR